ncbi:TIGR00296 family protein, partial [Candidatus Bathyarchaeota archaeon]
PQLVKVKTPMDYPSKIQVGQDGLIVEGGYSKGLLLPQVPVEWSWNEEEFLCQCCIKAGLSPDCWLLKGTKIYKFNCVIAQEVSPNGEVVVKDMGVS